MRCSDGDRLGEDEGDWVAMAIARGGMGVRASGGDADALFVYHVGIVPAVGGAGSWQEEEDADV